MEKDSVSTASDHGSSLIGCADVGKIKEALNALYLQVFIDGVNEHGFHVLPLSSTSIAYEDLPCVEQLLDDQSLGFAQQIIEESDRLGYETSHCVVTRWTCSRDHEWGDEWELVGVDALLTELICGTPDEQRSRLKLNEPRGLSAAEGPVGRRVDTPTPSEDIT